jgi:ankyrin repeat protein
MSFEQSEEQFDPRKSLDILKEFRQLMNPQDYNQICHDFKTQTRLILKEVLNQQDINFHSPLHIASYFGNFQAARQLVKLGAEPLSAAFSQKPLEIGKDRYTR